MSEELKKVIAQKDEEIGRLSDAIQLLNDFLEQSPTLSFIKDEQGAYVYVSQSFLEFFGVAREAVIGKTDFDWLSSEMAEAFVSNDALVRSTNKPLKCIEQACTPEGEIRSLVTKFPLRTASGRQYIGGVAVDIEGRLQTEELLQQTTTELAIARDQALDASRLKSSFVANISHELRTPLSGILGMLELLCDTQLTEEQRMFADTIQTSAYSLLSIIKDILDMSKIEAGKLSLEIVRFSPSLVVDECVRLMSESASSKGLELTCALDRQLPGLVLGDPERVRQILLNLISNSLKFTDAGSISVQVLKESDDGKTIAVRFIVADTGVGIAEKEQKVLFRPFSQVDSSTTRKYGGTGLGLSICKRLVEMMGGTIGFESKKGVGSTFWFAVPFPKVAKGHEECPAPTSSLAN